MTSWTLFAVLAGISVALYLAMRTGSLRRIEEEAGGRRPFDLRFSYNGNEARAFLQTLSPEGRAIYLGPQRCLDGAFLVVFTAALVVMAPLVAEPPLSGVQAALALLAGLSDAIENLLVSRMLRLDPAEVGDALIRSASLATSAKFVLTGIVLTVAILSLLA